jgi:hypothetical protein
VHLQLRQELTISLSYQAMSLTKLSLRAIPALASKTEEAVEPTKSVELNGATSKVSFQSSSKLVRTTQNSHNLVLGVLEDSLELVLGSLLDDGLDLLVRGTLLETGDEVDDGDVRGRDTESHTGQLSVEGRDDLSDGLGSTGRGGDDVGTGSSSSTPVLSGRSVDGLLGSGGGVNGGHETLDDSKVVVDDLGQGSQTVGGTRSVGDDVVLGLVRVEVDSTDEHGGISRGGRDDDLLGTSLQVGRGLVNGGEDTGRLDDVVGTGSTPLDLGRVTLGVDVDGSSVDDELSVLVGSLSLELSVGLRVVVVY